MCMLFSSFFNIDLIHHYVQFSNEFNSSAFYAATTNPTRVPPTRRSSMLIDLPWHWECSWSAVNIDQPLPVQQKWWCKPSKTLGICETQIHGIQKKLATWMKWYNDVFSNSSLQLSLTAWEALHRWTAKNTSTQPLRTNKQTPTQKVKQPPKTWSKTQPEGKKNGKLTWKSMEWVHRSPPQDAIAHHHQDWFSGIRR